MSDKPRLIKGPPSANTKQQRALSLLPLFLVGGIALLILILVLGNMIDSVGKGLISTGGTMLQEVFSIGILAFLVGAVQAWVFRENLSSNRTWQFVLASAGGGVAAGIATGLLFNALPIINTTAYATLIGVVTGGVAGAVSSLIQNQFIRNKDETNKWFFYSFFSWLVIWAIGRVIAWGLMGMTGIAVSAGFIMASTGVALYFYLPTTHIEF